MDAARYVRLGFVVWGRPRLASLHSVLPRNHVVRWWTSSAGTMSDLAATEHLPRFGHCKLDCSGRRRGRSVPGPFRDRTASMSANMITGPRRSVAAVFVGRGTKARTNRDHVKRVDFPLGRGRAVLGARGSVCLTYGRNTFCLLKISLLILSDRPNSFLTRRAFTANGWRACLGEGKRRVRSAMAGHSPKPHLGTWPYRVGRSHLGREREEHAMTWDCRATPSCARNPGPFRSAGLSTSAFPG